MYKYELVYTNIFLLFQVREPKRNDTTVAMSTFNTQYLVSNTIIGEMADSRTRAGKIQDESGSSCSPESKEVHKQ